VKLRFLSLLVRGTMLLFVATPVWAQHAEPTAVRKLQTSVYGLFNYTDTGLQPRNGSGALYGSKGHNAGITAGVDVSVYSWNRFAAAIDIRGSYPINDGQLVAEKSLLGGLRVSYEPAGIFSTPIAGLSRLRPYGDFLYGRGEMDYQHGGYLVGNLLYTQTAGGIYAGGGGVEVDVSPRFSFKADYQAEHWSTPVTPSGSVFAQQVGVGVAYRIGANQGPR
jgi:hypothetical protein